MENGVGVGYSLVIGLVGRSGADGLEVVCMPSSRGRGRERGGGADEGGGEDGLADVGGGGEELVDGEMREEDHPRALSPRLQELLRALTSAPVR